MTPPIPAALQPVLAAAQSVHEQVQVRPRLGIVLGSGLGPLADRLEDATKIPYEAIPNLPQPGVAGHSGRLHIGTLGGVPVACLQGRVHLYEGHPVERVVFGARLLATLGCEVVVLTNAAGATTTAHRPGSLLLIRDHLNLTGQNPLVGFRHPTQFLDMSAAYCPELRKAALAAARSLDIGLEEGVYAGLVGPSYETKAEVEYLSRIGADAVGMSTVLETIALVDLGVRVMALSSITNAAAGVKGAILDHEHVQSVAKTSAVDLERLIVAWAKQVFAPS
ncbi:MAG: purine-nucleoside phosphorylase [Polyangiaceae bacterium]